MSGRFRLYCPESRCAKSTRRPFSAATLDDLVSQVLQHVESSDCEHFAGMRRDDFENIVRAHWLEKGWRDDPDAPGPPEATPHAAAPAAAAPAPHAARARSRSIPRGRHHRDSIPEVLHDLLNQAGELSEQAMRLHRELRDARQRIVYESRRD